jgi:hypothetical protein
MKSRLLTLATWGLSLALLSSSGNSVAAPLCSTLHTSTQDLLSKQLRVDDFDAQKHRLQNLAKALIEANSRDIMHSPFALRNLRDRDLSSVEILNLDLLNGTIGPYKHIRIWFRDRDGQNSSLEMRSNGEIAFLDRSFIYREHNRAKSYRAVVFRGDRIENLDQTQTFLDRLPEQVPLSRTMMPAERESWITQKGLKGSYGDKLHFAFAYFRFQHQEPYLFQIPKSWLLRAYQRGQLEINTYDSFGRDAMPASARSPFGLEFEIVLVGKEILNEIAPQMQRDLRQDILKF